MNRETPGSPSDSTGESVASAVGRVLFAALLFVVAPLVLPACVLVAGAAAGATAVVVTGDDSVEVPIDRSMGDVYRDAVAVVERRGATERRDPEFYRFEGVIDRSRLWVYVSPLDSGISQLRVRARKVEGTLPDVELARDVATAVVLEGADREGRPGDGGAGSDADREARVRR
jgi:hypothetical protein